MTQIREDKVLEFKALTMSAAVLKQLPILRDMQTRSDMVGWVNGVHLPNVNDEWYIAEKSGQLVRISRTELSEFFAVQLKTVIERSIDTFRDRLPQIFVE